MSKTIVLGAGLTGLSLANQLGECIVIEKESFPGGTASSFMINNEPFDLGIHVLNTEHPLIKTKLHKSKRIAKINRHNIDYPYQINPGHINNKPESNPVNYKEYLLLKYEQDAIDFHIPYAKKFWGCDPFLLGTDWCKEYTPNGNGINEYFYYPKSGGIGSISLDIYNYLRQSSKIDFLFNEKVCFIDIATRTIYTNKNKIEYDRIYSTIPIKELNFDRPSYIDNAINELEYTSIGLRHNDNMGDNKGVHWMYFSDMNNPVLRMSTPSNWNGNKSNLSQMEISGMRSNIDKYIQYAYCVPKKNNRENIADISMFLQKYDIHLRGRYGRHVNFFMNQALSETIL